MKVLIFILFILIFLGILAGSNIYLSKRFAWYFKSGRTRKFYIGFSLITLYAILGIGFFSESSSFLSSVLYTISSVLLGFLLYLMLSVLLVHLLQVFFKLPRVLYGVSALSIAVLICVGGILNAFNPRITEVEVPIEGLEKELRVVQISDVHIGNIIGERFVNKIVDRVRELDPDMVFITGDLYDNKSNLNREPIKPLAEFNVPVYFVEGNHDKYAGSETVKKYLREINVRVLENEMTNQDGIQIIGLDHMIPENLAYKMHMSTGGKTIGEILPGIETKPEKPIILLHHSPDGIQYALEKGVDLYLAGHTHGGQIFPVNYFGELSFDFNRGLHNYQGTQIFVSQGVGTWGPPMRVGTRSEIALLRLVPDS